MPGTELCQALCYMIVLMLTTYSGAYTTMGVMRIQISSCWWLNSACIGS